VNKKRIGVLVSGRGSNLQALLDACRDGSLDGEIAVVISNVETAAGLERALAAGVPALYRDHRSKDRQAFDLEIAGLLEQHDVQLVCLAGFMRLLSPAFIARFAGRIVNVHPSLLPAFPGQHAQRQALEHGVKITGATVHLVDAGLDSGPIVMQEAVPVLGADDLESLSARILAAEHRLYPRAVAALLPGYRLAGRRLVFEARA
jgi:phosphoribosylglycinamide formyltransferase-1